MAGLLVSNSKKNFMLLWQENTYKKTIPAIRA
jgi:hypothetical protein